MFYTHVPSPSKPKPEKVCLPESDEHFRCFRVVSHETWRLDERRTTYTLAKTGDPFPTLEMHRAHFVYEQVQGGFRVIKSFSRPFRSKICTLKRLTELARNAREKTLAQTLASLEGAYTSGRSRVADMKETVAAIEADNSRLKGEIARLKKLKGRN